MVVPGGRPGTAWIVLRGQMSEPICDHAVVKEMTAELAEAFDRIDDFQAVQHGEDAGELLEAVLRLQEAVGIVEATRELICARLSAVAVAGAPSGHVLLGLILGLMAAQLEAEQRT